MHSRIAILFSIILFCTSCSAKYPVVRNNVSSPFAVQIASPNISTNSIKEQFIEDVINGIQNIKLDSLARQNAIEFVGQLYDVEYEKINTPPHQYVEGTISMALSNANKYTRIERPLWGYINAPKLSYIEYKWQSDNDVSVVSSVTSDGVNEIRGTNYLSKYLVKVKADIVIKFKVTPTIYFTNIEFEEISYKINCKTINKYGDHDCSSEYIHIEEDSLVDVLKNLKYTPKEMESTAWFNNKLMEYLNSRYKPMPSTVKKMDVVYDIDFVTAKARLQRSLGSNGYNEDESKLIIKKQYYNPYGSNLKSVTHSYSLSLYPDMNKTLIEISGTYEYFKDTFGGEDIYAQTTYDAEKISLMNNLSNILKR